MPWHVSCSNPFLKMPEDNMDSSISQMTLSGSTSDQPAGQGLSSVKKSGKGSGSSASLVNMIGGLGSFASLLSKKGDGKKEGALSPQVESSNSGRESFLLKGAMGHAGMDAIAFGTEISSEKNANTVPV